MRIDDIKKGFTLLEVLIATAIFASVMVVTTGVVSQSVNYQSKLKGVRGTSVETRKIASKLSSDIREVNNTGTVNFDYAGVSVNNSTNSKNGFLAFNCFSDGLSCISHLSSYTEEVAGYSSVGSDRTDNFFPLKEVNFSTNTLVLFNKNKIKVYWSNTATNKLYYFEQSYTPTIKINDIIINNFLSSSGDGYLLGDANDYDVVLRFGGYAPSTNETAIISQPYVIFNVEARTKDFDSSLAADRASTRIESTVTSRMYAQ